MIIYLMLLVISVFTLYYLENYLYSRKKYDLYLKLYFVILSSTLIFLGATRSYTVGADTSTYLQYFNKDFYYKIEIGYVFLSRTIFKLGFDFRVLLLVEQLLVIIPIMYIIYKKGKIKWLSVFLYQGLYLYVNSFNIFRQSIAMSLVLISSYVLIEMSRGFRRNILFLFLIFFASLFHTSALIFVLLWPLKDFSITRKQLVILAVGSVLIMLIREPLLTFVFKLLNRPYITNFSFDFGLSTIVLLSIFWTCINYNELGKQSVQNIKFIDNLIVVTLFFNIVWAWFPNHARISMYAFLLLSVYFPNVLIKQKNNKGYLIKISIIVFSVLGLYLFQLSFRDYGQVVPYSFFFQN